MEQIGNFMSMAEPPPENETVVVWLYDRGGVYPEIAWTHDRLWHYADGPLRERDGLIAIGWQKLPEPNDQELEQLLEWSRDYYESRGVEIKSNTEDDYQ